MKGNRLRAVVLALAVVLVPACGGDGSGREGGGTLEDAGSGGAANRGAVEGSAANGNAPEGEGGEGVEQGRGGTGAAASAGGAPAADPAPAGAGVDGENGAVVEVWFSRGETPVAVERRVEGRRVRDALEALVEGPTPAESAAGLTSWFSAATADALVSVREDSGDVVVDFRDLPRLIPSASSSAGSHQLLASLDSTVFQFPEVRSVEYRLEGSCQAFWEWLQRGCEVVSRP